MEQEHASTTSKNTFLKEALLSIRSLFVATISLVITLADTRANDQASSSIRTFKNHSEREQSETTLSTFTANDQSSSQEPLEVSVEIDNQNNKRSTKEGFVNYFLYPFLATISSASLIIGIARMSPLIQWARSQNECISSFKSLQGAREDNFAKKVMECNGGHEF